MSRSTESSPLGSTLQEASNTGPEGQAAATRVRTGAPKDRCVLIVDDEANILSSLRRLLRREPYEVHTTTNAEEALRYLESQTVHVVISDYRMPVTTGIDLLREVQQRWPDTIRIVLSGYSEVKTIIAAINEGAIYKFITKPWNDEELRLNVRRAIEQYDLEAENRRMAEEIAAQNERLLELNRHLDERAEDARAGLTITQDLLDAIQAGMVIVDESGLVVGANRKALEILQSQRDALIGIPAREALSHELYQAMPLEPDVDVPETSSGRVELGELRLQWRTCVASGEGSSRGKVVTLWEEIQ